MRLRSWVSLLLLFVAQTNLAHALSAPELTVLAGQVLAQDKDYQAAAREAEKSGAKLVAKGATSRELLAFVQKQVARLGKDGFLKELKDGNVSMLDWHRVERPLEFALIGSAPSYNEEQAGKLATGLSYLNQSHRFHGGWRIDTQGQYTEKFRRQNHIPTDHILLSGDGVMTSAIQDLPTTDGKKVSLGQMGLEAFMKREAVYLGNPTVSSVSEDLRTYLKLLQESTEFPNQDRSALESTLKRLYTQKLLPNQDEVSRLMREGSTVGVSPRSTAEVLMKLVEDTQLYSGDLESTRRLMKNVGLEDLLRKSGLASERLFQPLGTNSTGDKIAVSGESPVARPGKTISILHGTSTAGLQNIYSGNLFESMNELVLGGNLTAAVEGPALYTSGADGLKGGAYGLHHVELSIPGETTGGYSYQADRDWFFVSKPEAIRASMQTLQEAGLNRKAYSARQFSRLEELAQKPDALKGPGKMDLARFLVRSSAQILSPELHSGDVALWKRTLNLLNNTPAFSSQGLGRFFLLESFQNSGMLTRLLKSSDPGAKEILDKFKELLADPKAASALRTIVLRESFRSPELAGLLGNQPEIRGLLESAQTALASQPKSILEPDKSLSVVETRSWNQGALLSDRRFMDGFHRVNASGWKEAVRNGGSRGEIDFSDPKRQRLLVDPDPNVRASLRDHFFVDEYRAEDGANPFLARKRAVTYARAAMAFKTDGASLKQIVQELAAEYMKQESSEVRRGMVTGFFANLGSDREICKMVCKEFEKLISSEQDSNVRDAWRRAYRTAQLPDDWVNELSKVDGEADPVRTKAAELILPSLPEQAYKNIPDAELIRFRGKDERFVERVLAARDDVSRLKPLAMLSEPSSRVSDAVKVYYLKELMRKVGKNEPSVDALFRQPGFASLIDATLKSCDQASCVFAIKEAVEKMGPEAKAALPADFRSTLNQKFIAAYGRLSTPTELRNTEATQIWNALDPSFPAENKVAVKGYLDKVIALQDPSNPSLEAWRKSTVENIGRLIQAKTGASLEAVLGRPFASAAAPAAVAPVSAARTVSPPPPPPAARAPASSPDPAPKKKGFFGCLVESLSGGKK